MDAGRALLLATCGLAWTSGSARAQDAQARPNVLVVVADDVSEGDVDHVPTPHFDALAAQGIRFRRAYANPTCSPSRWSLTFGRYHARDAGLSCRGGSADMAASPSLPSLPRALADAGYRTALFGKWHLGFDPEHDEEATWESAPLLHGYELWASGMPANVMFCGGKSYFDWMRVDDGSARLSDEYNTDAILGAFLAWLDEVEDGETPWFAMVCYQAPHGPFHVPPGLEEAAPGEATLSKRERYALMLRSFDDALGRMLERVPLERTLVLVVGDNGTPEAVPGPAQTSGRLKGTTYEGGVRVPMVWAGPSVARGAESRALVHLVDVLPTVAERARAALPEGADLHGVSLSRHLEDERLTAHARVWCGIDPLRPGAPTDLAVVTPRFKYREVGGRASLHDLVADPREDVDLSGEPEHAALVRELAEFLEAHRPPPEERRPPEREPRRRGRRGRAQRDG